MKTYKVTIRKEKKVYMARNERRVWVACISVKDFDPKQGDLAHNIFHHDDIESSETMADGSCVAFIKDYS